MTQDPHSLANSIDHTLLRPEVHQSQYEKLCEEATKHSFASVCVPPTWVKFCSERLTASSAKVCTVTGFPLGYSVPPAKLRETEIALSDGAHEIDMVMNYSALINGMNDVVSEELKLARELTKGKIIKLILETCYLNDEQIVASCELATKYGWDFVKTSTGFGSGGATPKTVQLMKATVGNKAQVKASGGIRDRDTALKMLGAGASRIGTSDGVAIVTGTQTGKGSY